MESETEGRMSRVFDGLSGRIIAAAIAVHKGLGPGFLESVYEQALRVGLAEQQIPFEAQKHIDVIYNGTQVGTHVLDLLVDNSIVVELKAIEKFEDIHYAQVKSYLRATGLKVGLLVNFATTQLSVKRIVCGYEDRSTQ